MKLLRFSPLVMAASLMAQPSSITVYNPPRALVTYVDKIPDLKNLVVTSSFVYSNSTIVARGYWMPGDGGGGEFYLTYNTGYTESPATTNIYDTFISKPGGVIKGYWTRMDRDQPVDIRKAGAVAGYTSDTLTTLAIQHLQSAGLSTLIPSGTFQYNSQLRLTNNAVLVGATLGGSTLQYDGTVTNQYTMWIAGTKGTIQDLTFNVATNRQVLGLMTLTNAQEWTFRRLNVHGQTPGGLTNGFNIVTTTGQDTKFLLFEKCRFEFIASNSVGPAGEGAIVVNTADGDVQLTVRDTQVIACAHGIYQTGNTRAMQLFMENSDFSGLFGHAVYSEYMNISHITGCHFEETAGTVTWEQLKLGANGGVVSYTHITGNSFIGKVAETPRHIWLGGAFAVDVANNYFKYATGASVYLFASGGHWLNIGLNRWENVGSYWDTDSANENSVFIRDAQNSQMYLSRGSGGAAQTLNVDGSVIARNGQAFDQATSTNWAGAKLTMSDAATAAFQGVVSGTYNTGSSNVNIAITPANTGTTAINSATHVTGAISSGSTATLPGLTVTNTVATGLGSAAAPGHTFIGDTDTGMFSLGANSVSLGAGNNASYLTGTNGNWGIGTAVPAVLLAVRKDATDKGGELSLDNGTDAANNYSALSFNLSGQSGTYQKGGIYYVNDGTSYGRGDLYFVQHSGTSSANAGLSDVKMLIKNAGNVGINTTGPDRRLDVLDASNPQIRLTHTDGSVYTDLQTTSSGYLQITPSGSRVGIGVTPTVPLDIAGPVGGGTGLRLAGTGDQTMRVDATDGYAPNLTFYKSGAGKWTFGVDRNTPFFSATSNDLFFYDYAGTAGSRLVIKSSTGSVGVGTIGPDKQLEINSATGANLRLTYNDNNGSAANYADFSTTSSGDLVIAPSGTDTFVTGTLNVSTTAYANAVGVTNNVTFGHTTAGASPLTVDFLGKTYESLTLSGNFTFTASSNRAAGRTKTFRIICDGSDRTLAFNASWVYIGSSAPASIAANKTAILSLTCFGTAETDVLYSYAASP